MKLDSIYVRFIQIDWFNVQYLKNWIIYWLITEKSTDQVFNLIISDEIG